MEDEIIAANLKRLRRTRGLSQAYLAERARLSLQGYRNIESNLSTPKSETLHALARSLQVRVADLLAPTPILKRVRFRSNKSLKSREGVLSDVARHLSNYRDVEKLMREGSDEPEWLGRKVAGKRDPDAVATRVRADLGLDPEEPIRDIAGLLEANGIKVIPIEVASEAFFGLSVAKDDGGPAVVVNCSDRISVERRIFTAAHELGHLLLHLGAYDVERTEEDSAEEREADAFAAAFLMPTGVFRKEWADSSGLDFVTRVLKVKRIFHVSYRTVLFRLSADGGSGRGNLYAQFAAAYLRRTGQSLKGHFEPESVGKARMEIVTRLRAEEPDELMVSDFQVDRLASLVRRAVEEEKVSLSRAAEILGISLLQMRERVASWVA